RNKDHAITHLHGVIGPTTGEAMPRRKMSYESAPAAVVDAVERLGRNISLAPVRRQVREDDLAERGELGTGIGAYAAVLWALGFQGDLEGILSPERDLEGADAGGIALWK